MKSLKKNKFVFFIHYIPYLNDVIFVNPIIKKIHVFAKHPLISGATIIFIGGMLSNIFNFSFNLFLSRNLSFYDYGTIVSLFSIVTLFSLPAGAIIPTLVYFFASYFAKEDLNMIRGLYIRITMYAFFIGLVIFLFFTIFNNNIGIFFNIKDTSLITMAGLSILISFFSIGNQPLLQAKLAFSLLSFLGLFSSFLKLSTGVLFVLLGYSINAMFFGLILVSLIPYCLALLKLNFLFNKEIGKPTISLKRIFLYGAPATLATLGLTSLATLDIILVKHFFLPDMAGKYAIIALIGKVIFYFSAPIGTVMFPIIVQKYTKGENYNKDFLISLLLVIIPSILLISFYILFPEFVVKIFNENLDKSLINLIIPFGIIASLYGVISILINFFLAINRTKIFIPILFACIMQGVLISFFHKTFLQIIITTLIILCLLLLFLLLYYLKLYGEAKNR